MKMLSQSISFQPKTIIKQLPWQVNQRVTVSMLLVLIIFSLIGWLYLQQASIITASSMQVDNLRQEIELTHQRNNELRLEIATYQSIVYVEKRAMNMGFVPTEPTHIRYLVLSDYPYIPPHDSEVVSQPPSHEELLSTAPN